MRAFIEESLRILSEVIYPRHCLLSGTYLGSAETLLPSVSNEALARELPAPYGAALEVLVQRHVAADDFLLMRVSSCWAVGRTSSIDAVIYAIKYGGRAHLAVELGRLMAQHPDMLDLPAEAAIIGVPIHPARRRERGYNQAHLLAKGLSETRNLHLLDEGTVLRSRYTPTQTSLDQHDRQENVRSAFTVPDQGRVRGRHIILVDDVLTTGATLNSCATALIEAGARRVDAMTACVAV
jgi:ComF family protein